MFELHSGPLAKYPKSNPQSTTNHKIISRNYSTALPTPKGFDRIYYLRASYAGQAGIVLAVTLCAPVCLSVCLSAENLENY